MLDDEPPGIAILTSLADLDIENKIAAVTLLNHEDCDETVEKVRNRIQDKKKLQLQGQIFMCTAVWTLFS